jgi:hypothetical protein
MNECQKNLKDEGLKFLSVVDLRYILKVKTTIRFRKRTCVTSGDIH